MTDNNAILNGLRSILTDLSSKFKNESTAALFDAAKNGSLEQVEELLKHDDENVNAKSPIVEKVLFSAADNDKWDVVRWLVEHGADVNTKKRTAGQPCIMPPEAVIWTLFNGLENTEQKSKND